MRALRQLIPDYMFVGFFLVLMVPFEIIILLGSTPFGEIPANFKLAPFALAGFRIRNIIIVLAAAFYAILRVFVRHPFVNPPYRDWLVATPYRPGAPLPFGSVELNWRDLVVITILVSPIFLHGFELPAFVPITVFALTYSLLTSTLLPFTKPWPAAYVILALAAPGIFLWHYPVAAAVCTVCSAIVATAAMRMSLMEFPWRENTSAREVWKKDLRGMGSNAGAQIKTQSRDFHIYSCHPIGADSSIAPLHAVLLPLMAGWWMFCSNSMLDARIPNVGVGLAIFPAVTTFACALVRLLIYLPRYRPPLTIWGRLRTGRLIIPGYDKVLFAPLLAVILHFGIGIYLSIQGMRPYQAHTIGMVAALFALSALGPTLNAWQLTSSAQIRPWVESVLRASRQAQERAIRWQTSEHT